MIPEIRGALRAGSTVARIVLQVPAGRPDRDGYRRTVARTVAGPWRIEQVISAVSGPGYYVSARHAETDERTTGYVYSDCCWLPMSRKDEQR